MAIQLRATGSDDFSHTDEHEALGGEKSPDPAPENVVAFPVEKGRERRQQGLLPLVLCHRGVLPTAQVNTRIARPSTHNHTPTYRLR